MNFFSAVLLLSSFGSFIYAKNLNPLVTVRKGNVICNYCQYQLTNLEDFNLKTFNKKCSYQYIVRNKKYYNCGISLARFSYSDRKDIGNKLNYYKISLGVISKSACKDAYNVYCENTFCDQTRNCCEGNLCNDPNNIIINTPYFYKTIDPQLNITDNYQKYTTKQCNAIPIDKKNKTRCLTSSFIVQSTIPEPTTMEPTTLEPTTLEPTTLEPTTLEPTTLEPTTLEPTTLSAIIELTTPQLITISNTTKNNFSYNYTTQQPSNVANIKEQKISYIFAIFTLLHTYLLKNL